jgi:hypothetical protein
MGKDIIRKPKAEVRMQKLKSVPEQTELLKEL